MGRRKKESRASHREHIAAAASGLFMRKGIGATSMDDIAKAAGYSKATLYVYFKNKEEIIGLLTLESMKKLYDYIDSALKNQENSKERYDFICSGLVDYQQEFPFYFKIALQNINIDFENEHYLPEEKETYMIGEKINRKMADFLMSGIRKGELRSDIDIMLTVFSFWGMLSGLIQLAEDKEEYIKDSMDMDKSGFLEYGFDMLYRVIGI